MPTIFFTLRFEATMEQAVRQLWEVIAREGIEVQGLAGHRPHITVAAYDVKNVEHHLTLLDRTVNGFDTFPLTLDSLGIFPEHGVVFLAPRMTDALYSLHRRLVHDLSGPGLPRIKYEPLVPGNWMPHCTLVSDRTPSEAARVVEICSRLWNPIAGMVEAIGALVPPDVDDLHEARLRLVEERLS